MQLDGRWRLDPEVRIERDDLLQSVQRLAEAGGQFPQRLGIEVAPLRLQYLELVDQRHERALP